MTPGIDSLSDAWALLWNWFFPIVGAAVSTFACGVGLFALLCKAFFRRG